MSRIVLVDYEAGNLHSAAKALALVAKDQRGAEVLITHDPAVVAAADYLVLPGDGAFPACRAALWARLGLAEALTEAVTTRARPFLGICVGMQMMATRGLEYEETPGFGWIKGEVRAIAPEAPGLKIPHMGWNDLVLTGAHPVLAGLQTGDHAYFVHSYHMAVENPAERLAFAEYGTPLTAIVGRDTLIGTQFHPEKSQGAGLRLLANFLNWRP